VISLVAARQGARRVAPSPRQDSDFYPFAGGLNLIESPLSSEPGQCQNALNYEMGFEGGYKRIGGYEGFSGVPSTADNTDYYLLPFRGREKPVIDSVLFNIPTDTDNWWQDHRQVIGSLGNGGRAQILQVNDSGGYGQNEVQRNAKFARHDFTIDEDYWDSNPKAAGVGHVGAFAGDYIWPNGSKYGFPSLQRLIERSSTQEHWIQSIGATTSVAVGDMVYFGGYFKFKTGHPDTDLWGSAKEGVRLELTGMAGAFAVATDPYIDVRLDHAQIVASANIDSSGVDILEDDVLRVWAVTRIATTADTGNLSMAFLEATSPSAQAISYAGDQNGYVHVNGLGVVLLSPSTATNSRRNPMNYHMGVENFNTGNQWNKVGVTVADNDTAWPAGAPLYPDFSKILATAATTSHWIRSYDLDHPLNYSGGFAHIPFAKGDKAGVDFYVKHEASSADGIRLQLSSMHHAFADTDAPEIYINIDNGGTLYTDELTGGLENIDSWLVEEVETGIWHIQVVSEATITDGEFIVQLYMVEDDGSDTDAKTTFDGTPGQYLLITGLRISVMADPFNTKIAMPITDTAAQEVNTGELVVCGTSIGEFKPDDQLLVRSIWSDDGTPDRPYEKHYELECYVGTDINEKVSKNSETNSTTETTYEALVTSQAATLAHPRGTGPIRGVWMHRGIGYCFRDSVGGDECIMWQASGAGWRQVGNLWVVPFDAGSGSEPAPGLVIKDATTNTWGVVRHIDTISGTWGVDAAGIMYVENRLRQIGATGEFNNNNNLQDVDTSTTFAVVDGTGAIQTLPAGGRYEFRNANLYGSLDKQRMYFVNGKGQAMEYNGLYDTLRPVVTGMTTDTPTHLAIHNYHLFLGFPGGSVQLSGDGNPHSWTVITGATEIAVGDEITGFNEEVGNSLFIFTRNKSFVLQGTTRANFSLDDFNINAGAHEWSVQRIGLGMFFDDRGFTSLLQTQRSGSVNFQENAQSELIQPLVEDLVRNSEVKCSHLLRNQNIYRCYFDDGRIVSVGFSQHEVSGHMPVRYPFVANCACSEEDGEGAERILIGTDDGEVFELERGTTFDGDDVRAFVRSVLYHSKTPGRIKKYTHARLDGAFKSTLTLNGQIEYDFGDPDLNLADPLDFSNSSAGGVWDDMVFDQFVWDQTKSGNPQVKLEGEGTNAAIYLYSTSKVDLSHTLRGMTLQWMPRRADRRTT